MTRHVYALATALACLAAACGEPRVEEVTTTAAVPVGIETATIETLDRTLGVAGVIVPAPGGELTVTAPAAARIAAIPKSEGDAVRTGDLLVRFDIPSLGADLSARRAELDQARARAATTHAAALRLAGLLDRGIAAAREVEEARRDEADANAAVAQAETAVSAAVALQSRAEVHATFDGVVTKRWHQPGDLVDGAAGDPVLRVVDARAAQVVAGVPVGSLADIRAGQPARVTSPAGGDPVQARVTTAPAAVEPGQATADVRLAFAAPTRMPVGATVHVEIVLNQAKDAVVISRAAIVDEDGKTYVFVVGADSAAHRREVVVALTSADRVQIQRGLAAGDRVVVRGHDGLPDGAHVTVTP